VPHDRHEQGSRVDYRARAHPSPWEELAPTFVASLLDRAPDPIVRRLRGSSPTGVGECRRADRVARRRVEQGRGRSHGSSAGGAGEGRHVPVTSHEEKGERR
jgi:hypothetical protein